MKCKNCNDVRRVFLDQGWHPCDCILRARLAEVERERDLWKERHTATVDAMREQADEIATACAAAEQRGRAKGLRDAAHIAASERGYRLKQMAIAATEELASLRAQQVATAQYIIYTILARAKEVEQ